MQNNTIKRPFAHVQLFRSISSINWFEEKIALNLIIRLQIDKLSSPTDGSGP